MKKKSSKPKKQYKPTTVADECTAYREGVFSEYVCEVEPYLKLCPELRDKFDKQMRASNLNKVMQIHHVFGRSTRIAEFDWHCSTCQVFKATHDVGHQNRPLVLQLCSLRSKMARHERYLDLMEAGIYEPITDPSRLHWNVPAMEKCCDRGGLAGLIDGKLHDAVRGEKHFEALCDELLRFMGK